MTDAAILSALRKRQELEERIAKTEHRIKSFKTQISEINAFISQWEKFSGQSAPSLALMNPSQNDTDSDQDALRNSTKEDVAAAARRILSGSLSPMPRAALYQRLVSDGLRIHGTNPEMVLSTMLWRAGKDAGVVRVKSGGYWLKEYVPPEEQDESAPISVRVRHRILIPKKQDK